MCGTILPARAFTLSSQSQCRCCNYHVGFKNFDRVEYSFVPFYFRISCRRSSAERLPPSQDLIHFFYQLYSSLASSGPGVSAHTEYLPHEPLAFVQSPMPFVVCPANVFALIDDLCIQFPKPICHLADSFLSIGGCVLDVLSEFLCYMPCLLPSGPCRFADVCCHLSGLLFCRSC